MKVLGLDLSSKAGWATLEKDEAGTRLTGSGLVELGKPILGFTDGKYPWCYLDAAHEQALQIAELVRRENPDVVVIEETNLGKNRYSQKFLEFLHSQLLTMLSSMVIAGKHRFVVVYLSSSSWRSALGLSMTAEDRRNNTKLSKAKKFAHITGKKLDKAALGIKGKINKKHLAVRYANATYNLKLKMKDNDVADAICLSTAYLAGADPCDGQ